MAHTTRRLARTALAVAGAVAVLLGACSSSDLTPEGYFAAVDEQMVAYTTALDGLGDTYASELAAEIQVLKDRTDFSDTTAVGAFFREAQEVAIVKTAELFSRSSTALRTALDAIEALTPPEGLEQQHGDLVAAGEALQASMPHTIEAIRNLDSINDLAATIDAAPYTVAERRFAIACTNLATVAAAESEIEITCPPPLADDEGG